MQDPFADKSNNRLQREVQVWMAGLTCLLIAFLYLAVKRLSGPEEQFPLQELQSGVAHVTAPIEHDRNSPQLLNPPKLTSAPPIPTARFSAKSVSASTSDQLPQPSFAFPNHRKPAEASSLPPKPMPTTRDASPQPRNNNQFTAPQPKFATAAKLKSTTAKIDADAEALGRRRAKQLAAITSGLPQRLNQIQSSIKQASADLPVKNSATQENPLVESNNFVPVESFPAQPVTVNPIVANRDVTRPTVESSHPIRPVAKSISVDSIRRPDPQPDAAQLDARPHAMMSSKESVSAKVAPMTNSFQPFPAASLSTAVGSLPIGKPLPTPKMTEPAVRLPEPPKPAVTKAEQNEAVNRLPAVSASKQHVVEAGDSFFTIAQQHYGDGQWFRALRLANRAIIEKHHGLQPGMSLAIPTTEELVRRFPEHAFQTAARQPTEAERRMYVTQAGDTLFDIARRKTGQGSRFSEIIRANQFTLPAQIRASDKLPADLRLVMPESTLQ